MQLPLPENENDRLGALRSYRVLDTSPDERFDDVARLAIYVCGTPIGLVGLIDANRQWFKSRIGWDWSEIPREISFCTHTILQTDLVIVSDTLKDNVSLEATWSRRRESVFTLGLPCVAMLGYSSAEEVLKLSVAQDVFREPEEALRLLHKWQLTAEIEEEV